MRCSVVSILRNTPTPMCVRQKCYGIFFFYVTHARNGLGVCLSNSICHGLLLSLSNA